MQSYAYVSLVTLLTVCVYFWMATQVARTRRKVGILAPVMIGDPLLERMIRAHLNTLEWLPIFLPALWLFAIYWNATAASLLGLVWVIGRIVYFVGYVAEARRRFPGFFIQAVAAALLVLGAAGRILYLTLAGFPASWPGRARDRNFFGVRSVQITLRETFEAAER